MSQVQNIDNVEYWQIYGAVGIHTLLEGVQIGTTNSFASST